jgi:hypothetical protein
VYRDRRVADVTSECGLPDKECDGLPLSGSIAGSADAAVRVLVAVGIDERGKRERSGEFTCRQCHVERKYSNFLSIFNFFGIMSNLISCVSWVRRGVSVQHPSKYVLDDVELERVSALARIELEDARVELERAHRAAQSINQRDDDDGEDQDEDGWVE